MANKEVAKKEVVYLWKDPLINQTIKVPHPIDDINIAPALFYRYSSEAGQKAKAVLAQFQQQNPPALLKPKLYPISITLEGYAEYIEKCQYYQSLEELSKQKEIEIKTQQQSYKRVLDLIQKAHQA